MWPLLSKKLQVVGQVIDGAGVGSGELVPSAPAPPPDACLLSRKARVN